MNNLLNSYTMMPMETGTISLLPPKTRSFLSKSERRYNRSVLLNNDGSVDYQPKYADTYDIDDNHDSPFKIIMRGSGKVVIILLPQLSLETTNSIRLRSYKQRTSEWTLETFNYNRYDPNLIISSRTYDYGDEIYVEFSWISGYKRSFSVSNYLSQDNNTDYIMEYMDDFVGSTITCTCKYEVAGNIGSLISSTFKKDIYDINTIDKYAFAGLLSAVSWDEYDVEQYKESDTGDINSDGDSDDYIYYVYGTLSNDNLISAYNLYIPYINNVNYVYAHLFQGSTNLNYGPREIHVPCASYSCNNMFSFVQFAEDYCPIIIFDSNFNYTSLYSHVTENMFLYSNLKQAIININDIYNYSSITAAASLQFSPIYMMFNYCKLLEYVYINKPFTNNNTRTTQDDVLFTLFGNEFGTQTDYGSVQIQRVFTEPIIWIQKISGNISAALLQEDLLGYELQSTPYRFFGTAWVDEDLRSYYVWERYDLIADSAYLNEPRFVLTSIKDFQGMSLYDNIKNRCRPVDLSVWEDIGDGGYELTREYYENYIGSYTGDFIEESDGKVLYAWSGVVPDAYAGVPEIWIDDSYDKWEYDRTIEDYKLCYNEVCKRFKLVECLAGNTYMWRCSNWITNSSENPIPTDNSGHGWQYLVINASLSLLPFEHTIVDDETTDNYYGMEVVNSDGDDYIDGQNPKFDELYIVATNGIGPSKCDYTW